MKNQSGQLDQPGGDHQVFESPNNSERWRSKSKVWEEFTPVLRGWKIQRAECKHCRKSFRGKSSGRTSHLRRYLKICPALQPTTSQLQPQRLLSHPDSSVENNLNFDQGRFLDLLTKALVSNLCPFPLRTSTNLREFLAGIRPTSDVISQTAIEEKFQGIFQNEKLKLQEEIDHALGGVFLTLARWSLDSKFFVCVKAHFIDKDWNMISKLIGCKFAAVKEASEADYLRMFSTFQPYHSVAVWDDDDMADAEDIVVEVVQSWHLEGKLSGISLHKSLKDTGMFGGLHKILKPRNYLLDRYNLLSLPCILDSLHDLLECRSTFVGTSRDWFEYMTCSQLRREKYNEILSQLEMRRPCFGSKKWYLIFYLLEVALQFNRELPNPGKNDSRYYPLKPSSYKQESTENFCSVARLIYNAIIEISSPRNATFNLHFHVIWSLWTDLLDSSKNKNVDHVIDVKEMKMKFDELWRKWYLWLSLAVVLDPRYKFRFVDLSFTQIFGNVAKRYICEVRGKMYELFLQYSFYVGDEGKDECFNQINSDSQLDIQGSIPINDTALNYMDELSELIGYLEAELIPQNAHFDILMWWKDNAVIYPTLARLACDILAISGCAVSAESALDENDARVSLFNQKMSPEEVEALICTQDWISFSETSD